MRREGIGPAVGRLVVACGGEQGADEPERRWVTM